MSWTVTAAPAPDALAHPGAWAVHGASAVSHAVDRANWGHTDAAWTARALLTRLHEQTYAQRLVLVATAADGLGRADAVVGFAELTMPNQGNDHAAYLDVFVHPEHRGAGAGPALLAAGEALADRAGRGTVIAASEHPGEPAADDPAALVAPTGAGRIDGRSAGARFAARHGYSLAQAERYSMLELPVGPRLLDRLHTQAAAVAGDAYRLIGWTDRTPDEWVDGIAALLTRMSTDAPLGELDIREEPWDAARLRVYEAQRAAGGFAVHMVAAQHVETGELAGFTAVECPLDKPEVVEQGDTIVLRAHRGHRLGLLLKAEMLRRLTVERPEARRVHTWNAEENDHMLGINVALGFRPRGVVGVWQKTVSPG